MVDIMTQLLQLKRKFVVFMNYFDKISKEEYVSFLNTAISYGECIIVTYDENSIHNIYLIDGKEKKRRVEEFSIDSEIKKFKEIVEKHYKIHTNIKVNARKENAKLIEQIMKKMNFSTPRELVDFLKIPYHRLKNWVEFFPYEDEIILVKEKCDVELIRKPEYLTLREIERRVRLGELK